MSNPFRSRLLEVTVVALLTGCGGGAESPDPVDDSSLGGIVDAAVTAEMKAQGMPGMTVAIARNGVILYAQGYGYADLNTHQTMSADTVMQIGSVTKQFTATAILQLQDAGLLDIGRTVASYFPNYPFDPRITLRMLLNQTSGLQDYLDMPSLQQYAVSGMSAKVRHRFVDQLASIPDATERRVLATGRYIGEGFDHSWLDCTDFTPTTGQKRGSTTMETFVTQARGNL